MATGYDVKLNLNRKGHADIIEKLDSVPNMTAYLKDLIRRDIYADRCTEKSAGQV